MTLQVADTQVIAQYFQPLHEGHYAALGAARRASPDGRLLVLNLGAGQARSLNTPFTTAEREDWLRPLAAEFDAQVLSVRDIPYDAPRWAAALRAAVAQAGGDRTQVTLISDALPVTAIPDGWSQRAPPQALHQAEARMRDALLWRETPDWQVLEAVPRGRVDLRMFMTGAAYAGLREEAAFITAFRASWAASPYSPVFVTTDGIVSWHDEVVLIQRARAPGKGLWALPGGFIEPEETLAAGCRREISEETGLTIPAHMPARTRVFAAPARSLRGRTITHVFHFALNAAVRPSLQAADDAAQAGWFSAGDIRSHDLFEDHYAILQVMLGLA